MSDSWLRHEPQLSNQDFVSYKSLSSHIKYQIGGYTKMWNLCYTWEKQYPDIVCKSISINEKEWFSLHTN